MAGTTGAIESNDTLAFCAFSAWKNKLIPFPLGSTITVSTLETLLYTVLSVFEALIPFMSSVILLGAWTVFLTSTDLSDVSTYSDTETEIGTLSGSKVYRRVISNLNASITQTQTVIDSSLKYSDVETVLKINGSFIYSAGSTIIPIPYLNSSLDSVNVIIKSSGVTLVIGSSTTVNGYTVIIEYTKRT